MKNKIAMRRLLTGVLALLTLLSAFAFASCGSEDQMLSLEGVTVEEDVYRYWLAKYKNYYIMQYAEIGDDNESFQKIADNGVTVGEAIEDEVLQYAKTMLCSLVLFDRYKLQLNADDNALIDAMVEDAVQYLGGGDRSELNKLVLDTYGFDIDRLREIFVMEQKVDKVTSYLIENGGIGYTKSELDEFYLDNYYRLKIVFINTTAKTKLDENGKPVTNVAGQEESEPLTEEEKKAKLESAEKLFERAKNGEDFDKLVDTYSEFKNKASYPNGYYVSSYEFTSLEDAGMPRQLLLDSYSAKEGDVLMITDENSGCYIVKKCAPEKGAYQSGKADAGQLGNLTNRLLQQKYSNLVDSYWEKITVNDTALAGISILDVKRGLNFSKIKA